jgi:hypothetical protein
MKTLKLAIFCFVLSSTCYSVFGGNSTGETITFTVDANGYTGLLQLNSGGEPQFGGTEDTTFAFPLKRYLQLYVKYWCIFRRCN